MNDRLLPREEDDIRILGIYAYGLIYACKEWNEEATVSRPSSFEFGLPLRVRFRELAPLSLTGDGVVSK